MVSIKISRYGGGGLVPELERTFSSRALAAGWLRAFRRVRSRWSWGCSNSLFGGGYRRGSARWLVNHSLQIEIDGRLYFVQHKYLRNIAWRF